MNVPHLYSFICQWTFRLLPCLGKCTQCSKEYWGAHIFSNYAFFFSSGYISRNWIAGYVTILFLVFKELSILFSIEAVPSYIPNNSVGGLNWPLQTISVPFILPVYLSDASSYKASFYPHSYKHAHIHTLSHTETFRVLRLIISHTSSNFNVLITYYVLRHSSR